MGASVMEVMMDDLDVGVSKEGATTEPKRKMTTVVRQALKLRKLSRCVTVVVVSDDTTFLADFAKASFKLRLLVSSSRLLVFTRRPMSDLDELHTFLSMSNSMVLTLYGKLFTGR
ncbi:hypothetical protein Pcinc_014087 [Petrolisthes cinctipes]|uniref:Uncharacterized protein n=1 Tax=Petrolisthes cinctipes TaxID=88211 RepID=A0AAE1FXM1_PETCI|nr:hypothetical protein Pcinc_014087 [Petrolisthes cinctipes]